MENKGQITIIIPVYGRSNLLLEALDSVIQQESKNWNLLIADDGSDSKTKETISTWIDGNAGSQIRWVEREKNIGLFANLNKALELVETDWVLLLCSDDKLLSNAVSAIDLLRSDWPTSSLILSTFISINEDGSLRANDSAKHHDQLSIETTLIPPKIFIPSLLKLGSLNGNLTGMAFTKERWRQSGEFQERWSHAADWEWLIRAAEGQSVLLNRYEIAKVRTHRNQLSNYNRYSGAEIREVGSVVRSLRLHKLLNNVDHRDWWAANIMKHQLANILKQTAKGNLNALIDGLPIIHRAAGIRITIAALIASTQERIIFAMREKIDYRKSSLNK